jgi:hypothetical protein
MKQQARQAASRPEGVMALMRAIELILLGPGEVCCNALGVGEENNRDLVRMLINSLVWIAVGGIVIAVAV